MNVLFLMAGRGSRFKEAGYTIPKSLIVVRGKPMIQWATDSLPSLKNAKKIFICLKEHDLSHNISGKLKELYGNNIYIFFADHVTEGAAISALLSKKLINTDEELLISNADQYFRSSTFEKELKVKKKNFSGIIPVFEATHPRWSFAKINDRWIVTEVAEKVPISNHATVGVYYFKRGKDFVWASDQMIKKDIRRNNEFYVCPVFNELIGRGDKIKALQTDFMWSMGTPEDMTYFEKYYKEKSA